MLKAMKLAAAGVCAAAMLLIPTSARAADDFTTWLFAEGSTNSLLGFESELLIANPNTMAVTVTISVFSDDGSAVPPFDLAVAPLSRTGVGIRSLPGVGDRAGFALRLTAAAPIIAERTMYWGGGFFRESKGSAAVISDLRGGHNEKGATAGARTWYFAEGEGRFFNSFISVANPNLTPATVTATYRNDVGAEATETLTVPGNGRQTFWPSSELTRPGRGSFIPAGRSGFATTITSDLAVVAERQMYWGPGAPFGIRGGHAAMGVTNPSADWYFAEGVQGGVGGFDTYVLLYNHLNTTTDVTVTFLSGSGVTLATHTHSLPAGARYNVPASTFPELANQAFAIQVAGSQPVVAERAVYWRGFTEGHATAGATEPSRKWGFAEGLQGGFLMYQDARDADKRRFNTFFPIFNPQNTKATVTVHFYVENPSGGNTGVTKTIEVPARSRGTVWTLLYDELANKKFSTFFESDQKIVVERVVYWGQNNRAGHASLGTALPDAFPLAAASTLPGAPGGSLTVTPNRGAPSGDTVVEIEGTGFGHSEIGTQVLFGATSAKSFEVENDNTIRAVTPAGATGKVDVTVITKGQTVTAPQAFEYFDPWAAVGAPINTFRRNTGFGCTGGGRPCQIMTSFLGNVADMARRQPGDIANSCRAFGGNEKFVEDVIAELRIRTGTNRWGMNIKRGNQGLSEDIVTYYYGPEGSDMRNSTQVFIVDIIANHCNPANRSGGAPFWLDQTQATADAGTIGRWTLGSMCSSARYRNAVNPNTGAFLFPECR